MDFYKLDESREFGKIYQEMMWIWEWQDFHDYLKKYSAVSRNVDNQSKMVSFFLHYDGLGVQAKAGLLNIENIYDLYSTRLTPLWEKFAPIIYEFRRIAGSPQLYEHFEWLSDELRKMQVSREQGFATKVLQEMIDDNTNP